MTNEWKARILRLRYWEIEDEALEFVSLVDMAEDKCDLETCRILMKTFVTEEDYGVLESVNRVLSTAKPQDRQRALLEELPHLVVDTPEWAESLIESELRFDLDSFRETVRNVHPQLRETLNQVLVRESFREQFPNLNL